jgi:hypothetical protein
MRRFKSVGQARLFLSLHGVIQNLFRAGRYLLGATNYQLLRSRSFAIGRVSQLEVSPGFEGFEDSVSNNPFST